MMTAKLISDGSSQAARLPESCWLDGDEVYVNRIGYTVVLMLKKGGILSPMTTAAELFTDDFMENIGDLPLQDRLL